MLEGIIAEDRPDEESAKDHLAEDLGNFGRRKIAAQLATLLPDFDELAQEFMRARVVDTHGIAHRRAGQIGQKEGADHGGVAAWLFGHTNAESAKKLWERFAGGAQIFNDGLQLGELHFSEGQEEVVFAGEIIKEGALADVGGVGDVFDGSVGEAALGEEIEGGAEEALADLSAAALSATEGEKGRHK